MLPDDPFVRRCFFWRYRDSAMARWCGVYCGGIFNASVASDTDVVPRLWIRHTSDTPGLAVLMSGVGVGVDLVCVVSSWHTGYVDDDDAEDDDEEEGDEEEDDDEEEVDMDVDDDRASEGLTAVKTDGDDGSDAGVEATATAAGPGADAGVGGSRLARMLMRAEMSSMSISDWASLAECGASVRAVMAVWRWW